MQDERKDDKGKPMKVVTIKMVETSDEMRLTYLERER